ncbi:uncharacterized protein Triagg1_10186 [Trichoderma aggressivum f. europaeum]|uniref:Uncharacterized protein n=1 Tax=Trichoderma aggressivum f. europaeum TaxID=173218 RepID=A0AAE1I7L4_9HYPO|nr:hypothetical protein Triagg1_10186 [Trichoderma aggressivum f. europaeum]
MAVKYEFLTLQQIEHFLRYGWGSIPECFTREQAEEWTKDLWTRLGYDRNDPSTWVLEKINMPTLNTVDVRDLAPKAWKAICELSGGEDRVAEISRYWGDNFIVNFGSEKLSGRIVGPRELDNWHVDGDNFIHFLDSPNQGLLVIPCITDVLENGGATYICPDGIAVVAKHLLDNSEGVTPYMARKGEEKQFHEFQWFCEQIKNPAKCNLFQQMTGKCGDVVLMHPLMMHSASRNALHTPRVITNPFVSLKGPFNFNRSDPSDYSLIEKKTLKDLGESSLPNWKIGGERDILNLGRVAIHERMKEMELRRLAGENIGHVGDSGVEVHREIVKGLVWETPEPSMTAQNV